MPENKEHLKSNKLQEQASKTKVIPTKHQKRQCLLAKEKIGTQVKRRNVQV
jgi:hypothetical protein